ncbi:MAG: S9 family peptidase [Planctomycetes bacterium]|nr:S9 family peptidase [Planctomycetota bacterium]
MHASRFRICLIALAILALPLIASARQGESFRRPLDHAAADTWNKIQGQAISADGTWIHYTLRPGDPELNATLKITSADGETRYEVVRGSDAQFTYDVTHAIYLITPDKESVKKAKKEAKENKVKKDDMDRHLPQAKLEMIDLSTGDIITIDRVKSFKLPRKAGGWVAYLMERPAVEPDTKTEAKEEGEEEAEAEEKKATTEVKPEAEPEVEPEEEKSEVEKNSDDDEKEKKKDLGTVLILRNLATNAEFSFENVIEYAISEDSASVIYAASAEEPENDGVFIITPGNPGSGDAQQIIAGKGNYKKLAIGKPGVNFAFLADRDTYEDDQPEYKLYSWREGLEEANLVAAQGTEGIPEGWWVSENRAPSFSEKGSRLLFGTAPRPEYEKEKTDEEKEEAKKTDVVVDIWNWKDDRLQPQQLYELKDDKKKTYLAAFDFEDSTIVQLANEDMPDVTIADKGDGDVAFALTHEPYNKLLSWDWPFYNDLYLIEVATGKREKVVENLQTFNASLSPQGKYIVWWDGHAKHWFAMNTETKKIANLTEVLPHPVHNELHDTPQIPGPYGSAGWVEGDQGIVIYDKHDIWLASPDGFFPPSCITDNVGRENNLRLRYIDLEPDENFIDSARPMLLSAINLGTKDAGFYRDQARGTDKPVKLIMSDERFGRPRKAEETDTLMLTRERFDTFRNLWVSDADFADINQISNANPQQDQYRWGTSELIEWNSTHGETLQGFLCKPDGFDPSRKYPLMVYFYERNSDNLHQHVAPEPFRSIINRTFYVSRGYLVFVPDIPYRNGYPGESAMNAVMPGITHLMNQGFVDEKRIGVQGHSWGGYQIAYMVTRTNLFAAAEAGAIVSNMTSAYGGIRWGSGLSRMFQYEKTQSRIGGTLWNAQQRYIENSPVFWADKIETPLLMMHNDNDGAVPWYQGIEMFVSMRRLGKPVWMLNYNGEPHNLLKWQNKKDWATRMQQFFDHYLKDAPAPVWLEEGVPAMKKGKTLGLELVGVEPEGDRHERLSKRKAERDKKFTELCADVMDMKKATYASSVDGMEIPVYVFQPLKRIGGQTYPALVWIHGGVHGDLDPEHYFPFLKDAVERGYVVVCPEYRGSTGYGKEHYDAIDYGGYEVEDCLSAVDYIRNELPYVDLDRLGMIGWSHGGFITLHAMARDHETFKCAAAHVPVTNLVFRLSYKGPRYQEAFRTQERIAGLPHEKREIYIERSPLYQVDKIQTPMIVHVADNDEDVDFVESEQLINALKVKKPDLVQTKIYHDPPGGHAFNRQVNWEDDGDYSAKESEALLDSWKLVWEMFDKYLMPKE